MKRSVLMTLTLSSLLLLSSTSQGASFETLTHHWNFDEGPDWHDDAFQTVATATVAKDVMGSANATLQGMTGSAFVSGRQYTGLAFDGVNDSLLAATSVAPTLGGTSSLSFWIKTTQTGTATAATAPGVLGSRRVQWGWIDDAGKIVLSVNGTAVVRSASALNDGNWHHLVLTRNAATGAAQVFVDGTLSASATGPKGARRRASITRIAHMENGSAVLFKGTLDQIHAFSGVVDASTVQALYDNHAPKTWVVYSDGETSAPFSTDSVLVSTYAYDAEQDTLSVASFTQPAHGSVAHNGDGAFTYAETGGYIGSDMFTVTITDGRGGFTENTVNVVVTGATAPDAANRTTTFTDFQAINAGGASIALSGLRTPRAIDWDNDGDQDLLIGHSIGIWRYKNIGTPANPVFAAGVKVKAGGVNIYLPGYICIALADMTGDGIDDLVAVNNSRNIRVYRNTSAAGQVPVYAAATIVRSTAGGNFVLPDQRFDAADWDGDGLVDIVMGKRYGELRAYRNVGTATTPLFDPSDYEVTENGSYNLFPRVFDLNRNGVPDYIRGINSGSINFWFDSPQYPGLGSKKGALTVLNSDGSTAAMQAATDGAIVDFADFNGDNVLDILIGGYARSSIYIAYGVANTVADSIAAIAVIYDAHPTGLGAALDANNQALLNEILTAEANILMHMQAATLSERQAIFAQMVAHVGSYSFLQMDSALNTVEYNHVPSIAGQNLMTMHKMLPDTPGHRTNVANAVGLIGIHREIYLQMGLHVGDNQRASQGQLESIRDFMLLQPYESFPDSVLTLGHYYGNGRGGYVSIFRGAKNTFGLGEGKNSTEWASDLNAAAEAFYGSEVQRGDYFTFVMGHEVTHSLDGYVYSRANQDLTRRKGQMLTWAAGPDVLSSKGDNHDYWDWTVTKARFRSKGYWDGNSANWNTAWEAYWTTGPGAAWRKMSFMRGNIDWFLKNHQESLATQANHHWAHAEARLIGAIDRYQRGVDQGIEPMKANITEVITFLDWISCGMNKIVMQDTTGASSPYPHAEFHTTHAWIVRNDKGYITKLTTAGRTYEFELDEFGIVTDLISSGAKNPNPSDGAMGVKSPVLGWTKEVLAVSHNVYIGTNLTAVAGATQASPEFGGTTTAPSHLATLTDQTQYFWRIDTVTKSTTVTGNVWSFTTGTLPSLVINPVGWSNNGGEIDYSFDTVIDNSGLSDSLNSDYPVPVSLPTHIQPSFGWWAPRNEAGRFKNLASGTATLTFDLGVTNTLDNCLFWNGGDYQGVFYNGCGIAGMTMSFSTDGVNFSGNIPVSPARLADTDAPSDPEVFAIPNINARYIKLSNLSNHNGNDGQTVIAEIKFTYNELSDADGDGIPDAVDPDDDNDGMTDDWEIAHSLNPLVNDKAGNPDLDEYDNWYEYVTDTNPQDANSKQTFSIKLAPGTGVPSAIFGTSANRRYVIEYRVDLTKGTWLDLERSFPGSGSEMTVPNLAVGPCRYYRLRVELP